MPARPTLDHILAAAERIRPFAHRTPVLTCAGIDAMCGASLFFKCENFQKVGAFKFRGAANTVFSLTDDEAARGVVTHSSGNHAAALALAARLRGCTARIVMPSNAPAIKKAAVAEYGGIVTYCAPTLEARETATAALIAEHGCVLVHPYDDARIIAGQGTAALELLREQPELDLVMAPVGGGGLLSGTAIAVTELSPRTRVIAAEPERADDAHRSLREKRIVPSVDPDTIADGLLTSLGEQTFPIILARVERIVLVSERGIVAAMRHIWERMKIIVEPSAAVPLGAILEQRIDVSGMRVGIILSGGNVDMEKLPWNV
ncbi:MAG: pyridoxal-phosphate dependent enzyme [Ignavibacteria bacterium]|nr:pyridoxal-phosphate dependent enzyme [Ignavibacteria bacterium]